MARYRYRRRRENRWLLVLVAAVAVAGVGARHAAAAASPHAPAGAARQAIAYAEAQLGKPYEWGATGPDAFDCSGLVMEAYASAGVTIPRTSAGAVGRPAPRPARRPGARGPGVLRRR